MNRNDNRSNWNVKTEIIMEVNGSVCSLEMNGKTGKKSWEKKLKRQESCGTQTMHVSHTYTKYTQSVWCSLN